MVAPSTNVRPTPPAAPPTTPPQTPPDTSESEKPEAENSKGWWEKTKDTVKTHLGAGVDDAKGVLKGAGEAVEIGAMMPAIFMKVLVFLMAKMFGGDMMKKFLSPEQAKVLGMDLNDFKDADAKNGAILGKNNDNAAQPYNYVQNLQGHTLADHDRQLQEGKRPPGHDANPGSANIEPQPRLGSSPDHRTVLASTPVDVTTEVGTAAAAKRRDAVLRNIAPSDDALLTPATYGTPGPEKLADAKVADPGAAPPKHESFATKVGHGFEKVVGIQPRRSAITPS